MRFAQIATLVAAVISAPLVAAAVGPAMSSGEFVSAARCVAIESISGAQVGWPQAQLNAEARRQSAATAARARGEIGAVAEAARANPTQLRNARHAACAGVPDLSANGSRAGDAA